MIYSNEYISSKLNEIGQTGLKAAPIEGVWQKPPYENVIIDGHLYALIIKDCVFTVIVSREDGSVIFFDNDGQTSLINSTLEKFCKCAIRWGKLHDIAEDINDEEREIIALELENDLKKIDKLALEDEN